MIDPTIYVNGPWTFVRINQDIVSVEYEDLDVVVKAQDLVDAVVSAQLAVSIQTPNEWVSRKGLKLMLRSELNGKTVRFSEPWDNIDSRELLDWIGVESD